MRQAVAGDRALEQLDRHGPGGLPRHLPLGPVNQAAGALAEQIAQGQLFARHRRMRVARQAQVFLMVTAGVAGKRQPGEARQLQQPGRQVFQAVGGDAQQFEVVQLRQAVRQFAQLVAGQHQLLQAQAVPQLRRQAGQAVVGKDQPAQLRRQRGGRQVLDGIALEPDHFQLRALAQHGRHLGKGILGAEQDAQPVQARQVIGQAAQAIAGEVEHLQRVGQVEDFPWELLQVGGQVKAGDASQLAAAKLLQAMHAGGAGGWC